PSTSQSAAIRDEIHDTLATWESAYFANEEVVHINQGLLYDDDELYGILADNVEDTLENCSQGIETQEAHDLSFCEDFSSDNETEDVTTTREWHYGNAPNTNNLDFTATAGLKAIDMGTLKTFIGLVIHMGTIQYSRMSDYWKTHYLFKNDIFRKYMPRNNIPLTRELLNSRTFCTGTLKMNRKGNPKELLKTKIKKGECIILHDKNNITLAKWMDKREVLFLSSEHNSVLEEVRNRNRNSTSLKPRAIIKYNKYMRNVDKHDQMLSYYTGEHKSVRWYKKVIIHLIEVCLVNSYQLFKSEKKLNISLYDFRANILERLLPPIHPREEIPLAICPMHFPKQITKEPNSRRAKRKQCRQCAKQKTCRHDILLP
ncbi:hypothetical protein HW555_012884, partial [Spodoptera exigua]